MTIRYGQLLGIVEVFHKPYWLCNLVNEIVSVVFTL